MLRLSCLVLFLVASPASAQLFAPLAPPPARTEAFRPVGNELRQALAVNRDSLRAAAQRLDVFRANPRAAASDSASVFEDVREAKGRLRDVEVGGLEVATLDDLRRRLETRLEDSGLDPPALGATLREMERVEQRRRSLLDSARAAVASVDSRFTRVLQTEAEADAYFGSAAAIRNPAFLLGESNALYVEFFSDNAYFRPFGYARYGFGALVESDSSSSSTAEAFLGNGGNVSFNAAFPFWRNRSWQPPSDPRTSLRRMLWIDGLITTRLAGRIPGLDQTAESPDIVFDVGLDNRIQFSTMSNVFVIGLDTQIRAAVGSAGFLSADTNANLESSDGVDGTTYGTFGFRLDIAQQFRIQAQHVFHGPEELRNLPFLLSVQLLTFR